MDVERYTPTRLEWLALNIETKIPMLLSQLRRLKDLKTADDIRVFLKAKEPNTVFVVTRYVKDVPKDVVQLLNEEIKREALEIAKRYGWDSWVKVEWDVP
jgi:hypothetical protein